MFWQRFFARLHSTPLNLICTHNFLVSKTLPLGLKRCLSSLLKLGHFCWKKAIEQLGKKLQKRSTVTSKKDERQGYAIILIDIVASSYVKRWNPICGVVLRVRDEEEKVSSLPDFKGNIVKHMFDMRRAAWQMKIFTFLCCCFFLARHWRPPTLRFNNALWLLLISILQIRTNCLQWEEVQKVRLIIWSREEEDWSCTTSKLGSV